MLVSTMLISAVNQTLELFILKIQIYYNANSSMFQSVRKNIFLNIVDLIAFNLC